MMTRRSRCATGSLLLVLTLVAGALGAFTASAGARQADRVAGRQKTRTAKMTAQSAAAGTVKVTGWATFSGQMMGSVEDKKDDGTPSTEAATEAGAESIGSDFLYRPENEDFFWRFEVTKIPVILGGLGGASIVGVPSTIYVLPFSAKGVSYEIRVASLGRPNLADPTGSNLGASFGLFRCDTEDLCVEAAQLKGGYGTTGERIVVALPLSVLRDDGTNIKEGDKIAGLGAYVGGGLYESGVVGDQIFDQVQILKAADAEIPIKSVTIKVGKKSVKVTDGNGLKDGYFNAEFPASAFKKNGPTTVKTRTCLGKDCVNQSFKMTP